MFMVLVNSEEEKNIIRTGAAVMLGEPDRSDSSMSMKIAAASEQQARYGTSREETALAVYSLA